MNKEMLRIAEAVDVYKRGKAEEALILADNSRVVTALSKRMAELEAQELVNTTLYERIQGQEETIDKWGFYCDQLNGILSEVSNKTIRYDKHSGRWVTVADEVKRINAEYSPRAEIKEQDE